MAVVEESPKANDEALELRLDEALLGEMPALQYGLDLLKLCIAITPLLGLLGTVVGMIEAMQSMTLTNLDRMTSMAMGISRALITTALGLIFAVPMLIFHAFASSLRSAIEAWLEEYCASAIAYRNGKDALDHTGKR